ncbi:hypothetical protein D3C86_2166330 [compost metagenome]
MAQAIAADAGGEVVKQGGEGSLVGLLRHAQQVRLQVTIWVIHAGRGPVTDK